MAIKTASGSGLSNSLSSGLVLLNTTSFSGVSSQSVNDVFSASYDNYRIIYNSDNISNAGSSVTMRMRVSGADNSSANYNFSILYNSPATANTNTLNRENNAEATPTTSFYVLRDDSDGGTSYSAFDIHNPFATKKTALAGFWMFSDAASRFYPGFATGQMTVTTSYTGFTIISSSGNIGGTISVYGYNK